MPVIVRALPLLLLGVATCSSWWTTPVQGPPEPGNPCGAAWHTCSDGGCCADGWSCTTDRLPVEADKPGEGSCEDNLGHKRPASRPRR